MLYPADVYTRSIQIKLGALPSPAGGRQQPPERGQRRVLLVEICIGECQASLQRHVRHSPGAGAPVLLEAAETRDEGAEPSVRDGGGGKGDPDAVAVEGSRAREEGVVADGRVCRVGAARMEEPAA